MSLSYEGREPRHASLGELLVSVGDQGSDGRGVIPLSIRHPRADLERGTVGGRDLQCPTPTLVPALALGALWGLISLPILPLIGIGAILYVALLWASGIIRLVRGGGGLDATTDR